MNIKSSIGLVAVIALSLFAARAGAQVDSNAMIFVRCGSVCSSCTMSITRSGDTSWTFGLLGASSCVSFDTARRYADWKRQPTYLGMAYHGMEFTVDTLHNLLAITLTSQSGIPQQSLTNGAEVSGVSIMRVSFDSLPYADSSGHLQASGLFPCSYQFNAWVRDRVGRYGGQCSNNGRAVDSLTFEVTPSADLRVASSACFIARSFYMIFDQDISSIMALFAPSTSSRTIDIYDLLCRNASTIFVPPSIESIRVPLSLPPGIYFARLGNQLAKFVVPPR